MSSVSVGYTSTKKIMTEVSDDSREDRILEALATFRSDVISEIWKLRQVFVRSLEQLGHEPVIQDDSLCNAKDMNIKDADLENFMETPSNITVCEVQSNVEINSKCDSNDQDQNIQLAEGFDILDAAASSADVKNTEAINYIENVESESSDDQEFDSTESQYKQEEATVSQSGEKNLVHKRKVKKSKKIKKASKMCQTTVHLPSCISSVDAADSSQETHSSFVSENTSSFNDAKDYDPIEDSHVQDLEEETYVLKTERSFYDEEIPSKRIRLRYEDDLFRCETCDQSFENDSLLTCHIKKHLGEKPFECETCLRCFARKADLKVHFRKHTGEKPFKCEFCDMCFVSSSHLNKHKKRHVQ